MSFRLFPYQNMNKIIIVWILSGNLDKVLLQSQDTFPMRYESVTETLRLSYESPLNIWNKSRILFRLT